MIQKLTPDNIIASIDRYIELRGKRAELDRLIHTGTPHDTSAYVDAAYELPELEAALLDAGLFKTTTGDVVSWAARPL